MKLVVIHKVLVLVGVDISKETTTTTSNQAMINSGHGRATRKVEDMISSNMEERRMNMEEADEVEEEGVEEAEEEAAATGVLICLIYLHILVPHGYQQRIDHD